MKHDEAVSQSFGPAAHAYLKSAVHAQGDDLKKLGAKVAATPAAHVLDLGCGAGHASFAVAPYAAKVIAYDLTQEMLAVVDAEAARRGFGNLRTQQGSVEKLPFQDASFDWVVSRYSAHHWRNVPAALQEIRRVLKPGGSVCFIDIAGNREALLDTYLQSIELLRDPSHVRDYTDAEWVELFRGAGLAAAIEERWRLPIEFSAWITRMNTPPERVEAIQSLWRVAPIEVRDAYQLQPDFSFELDSLMLITSK
jgi:ubiquinone/menaquinone biosynthesis C-methylase UbiE